MINDKVTVADALVSLIGYSGWAILNNEVVYYPDAISQPTMEQINQEIARLQPLRDLEIIKDNFRNTRADLLSRLTVTVNNHVYDADEQSQARMANAILAAQNLNSDYIPFWVLADNTVLNNIPLTEFKQAHAQSVLAMASIWLPSNS